MPGAGKTILASAAIRYLLSIKEEPERCVAFVFCNYRMQQSQTAETLLAAILRQVTKQCPVVPKSIRSMYDLYKSNRVRPSFIDLVGAICSIARDCPRFYVVIDALDECLDSTWKPLIQAMRKLQQEVGTGLLVTSRLNERRRREFMDDIQFEIRAQKEDIESFLRGQMGILSHCVVEDPRLQTSIIEQITQLVDGMFLLAKLHLESLKGRGLEGMWKTSC